LLIQIINQHRANMSVANKRISSLPSVAGTSLRAHFASLKSCTHKLALYAGCYVYIGNFMLKSLSVLLFLFSFQVLAGEYASEANENPFKDGELNAKYEGELTAIGGIILKQIVVENNKVYLLDLKTPSIKPIWVTSFITPEGKKAVEIGDNVIFKGYISRTDNLDETGELMTAIKSETLLMAIYALNQGV